MMTSEASFRAPALGEMRRLEIGGTRIQAHVTGEGPPIVFVHGALVNANLWRKVVPLLTGYTRVSLDLPLGSHLEPQGETADLSAPALAGLISGALESLDLSDAAVVGNDTGGALTQIAVTTDPQRIGRVVLTSCDAFDNFPPRFFRIVFAPARLPGGLVAGFAPMRIRALRRLPIAYGWLSKRPVEPAVSDSWVLPVLSDRGVRRDLQRVLAGIDVRYTLQAAQRLRSFDRPVLLAWSKEDRFFPAEHAERLAALLPDARLEWIEDSLSFSPEDQPERLAGLIRSFVPANEPAPAESPS
jgi:pimeloyl-ACP methyl ester carboxylesterase